MLHPVGELLSKCSRTIDPLNTCLRKDIWVSMKTIDRVKTRVLNVRLKSSKESRASTRGIVVEIFGNSTRFCPVAAYLKYRELLGGGRSDSAAFRTSEGWAYHHKKFNSDLKSLLGGYISYGSVSGHSFRSGLASLMAMAGFSDETIKAAGRWSSDAFKRYIKLKRVTRVAVAERLAALM